ncbi:MAG TPA: M56 family metallopeptidase [Bryobacteraceae bacterium]|nr:M56 family metallopeptidase [Bryobacteraceae bacterium]
MTEAIVGALVQLGSTPELDVLGKATLALGVGLALASVMGGRPAYLRHLVLASAFAVALVTPFIVLAAPRIDLHLPVNSIAQESAQAGELPSAPNVQPQPDEYQASSPGNASFQTVLPPWQTLARLGWIAGSVLMLLSLALGVWRLRVLRREGIPCPELESRLQAFAEAGGVGGRVELLLHPDIGGPLTCGILRPAILLPEDAVSWADEDLRRALVHELEHVRRADWTVQLVARATSAVYWFNPLVWIAWRKLSLEAERACDDAVLDSEESTAYAHQLVSLARQMTRTSAHPALGMARRSDLSARVRAVLDPTQTRGRRNAVAAVLALSGVLVVATTVAPLRALAQVAQTAAAEKPVQSQPSRRTPLDGALLRAAEEGNVQEVERLLAAGANVNAKIEGDGSPLIAAARSSHEQIVKLLLDRGADVNLAVGGDGSPLIVAAQNGQLSTVRLLLERGADIHMPVPGDGNPLIMAARGGSVAVVEFLLNRGANIEQVVPGDENALIEASASGHLPVIKLLIDRGANINARVWVEPSKGRPGEWRTPLSMARRNGHTEAVSYLRSAGARE